MTKFWRYYIKFICFFISDGPDGDLARGNLYRPFLKRCGKNFKLATQAFIYNPSGLSVGDDVYIGFCSYIGQGDVVLEDEVLIGNFVSITASNHLKAEGSYRFGGFEKRDIYIGRGTWIGAHACILAGVRILAGSLVGAGAVVTKSIDSKDAFIVGVPAQLIKVVN